MQLHRLRVLSPYVPLLLRKLVVKFTPSDNVMKYRNAVQNMDEYSRKIYSDKKAALERGDDAVVQQIGDGRDIISTLSK